jgi:membrane protein insertase Oxa1/YidC/SpoIIIJ
MTENNIHPFVTYLPMLCQASVFMSMYVSTGFFALSGRQGKKKIL